MLHFHDMKYVIISFNRLIIYDSDTNIDRVGKNRESRDSCYISYMTTILTVEREHFQIRDEMLTSFSTTITRNKIKIINQIR